MALREIHAIVMSAAGRTAMPTALPEMTLPSMLLPEPERLRPNVRISSPLISTPGSRPKQGRDSWSCARWRRIGRRRRPGRFAGPCPRVAGAVEDDELAAALPRRALDRHWAFDRRQRRSELDHVRRLTRRVELDAQASGRRVVALDRPAQRTLAAVIGGAGDAQHLGRRRRRALRAGRDREYPKRDGGEITSGTCRHCDPPQFPCGRDAPHWLDSPCPKRAPL